MTIFNEFKIVVAWIDSHMTVGRTGLDWERRDNWNKFKKRIKEMEKFIDELDRKEVIKWDGEGWVIRNLGGSSP